MTPAEHVLFEALGKRYSADRYALLNQVRNGTGWSKVASTADAIAIGLWPSRGLQVHGFEFKASRADWLKELKTAGKSDELWSYCTHWWVVATDVKIVPAAELPTGWGLLVLTGAGLRVGVEAAFKEATKPDWLFVAATLRRAATVSELALEDRYRKGEAAGKATMTGEIQRAQAAMLEFRDIINAFEAASGLNLRYAGDRIGRIGAAVRALAEGPDVSGFTRLSNLALSLHREAEAAVAAIRNAAAQEVSA